MLAETGFKQARYSEILGFGGFEWISWTGVPFLKQILRMWLG